MKSCHICICGWKVFLVTYKIWDSVYKSFSIFFCKNLILKLTLSTRIEHIFETNKERTDKKSRVAFAPTQLMNTQEALVIPKFGVRNNWSWITLSHLFQLMGASTKRRRRSVTCPLSTTLDLPWLQSTPLQMLSLVSSK